MPMYYRFCGLRPGMIKFMLLLIFLFNIVGWTGIMAIYNSFPPLHEKREFSPDEEFRRQASLRLYARSLVEAAVERKACGKIYSPYDYFNDLKLIRLKKQELRVEINETFETNPLFNLVYESLKRGYTDKDIEKAREAYKDFIDPARESREEVRVHLKAMGWGILNWFWLLYLKTLPLVFVLFLLWVKEEQGYYKKFLLPKPLGFSLLLIFYPAVIGYYIFRALRDDGRRMYVETELRRTKNLFSHISEEEQEKIEAFTKGYLSLSEWRRQLCELGLKPRHSFAAALLVTLVFVFVIRPAEAGAKQAKDFAGNFALEEIAKSQNLARMSIDDANKIQPEKYSQPWDIPGADLAVDSYACETYLSQCYFAQKTIFAPITKFFRKIFHVPIQAVRFEANIEIQPQS